MSIRKQGKKNIVRNVQRYKCKECGNNFTIDYSHVAEKERKRRFGLDAKRNVILKAKKC